jgi:hypothetical protein
MSLYTPTQVIALDTTTGKSSGSPFYYAVAQEGGYSRQWQRYFSSQAIAYGQARITGIDNGPGINQYTLTLLVTNWPTNSLPYLAGVTQTWDVQKSNLEASFKKIATPLYFIDPFGVAPNLDPTTGVYFWQFTETILKWSTPTVPFIEYSIILTQSPPGTIIS